MYLISKEYYRDGDNIKFSLFLVKDEEKAKEVIEKLNKSLDGLKSYIKSKDSKKVLDNGGYLASRYGIIQNFRNSLSHLEYNHITDEKIEIFSYKKIEVIE